LNQFSGQLIYVEDRAFRETLARLVAASDGELIVLVGGVEARLPVGGIRRVSVRGDSLRNGAWLGALAGIVPGIFGCQGASSDCSVAGMLVVAVGAYSALGAWIDSRRVGRTVVYEAP
jgi:hypothetical protein